VLAKYELLESTCYDMPAEAQGGSDEVHNRDTPGGPSKKKREDVGVNVAVALKKIASQLFGDASTADKL